MRAGGAGARSGATSAMGSGVGSSGGSSGPSTILDTLPDRLNNVWGIRLSRIESGTGIGQSRWKSMFDSSIFSNRDLTDSKRAFLLSSVHCGETVSLRLELVNVSGHELNVHNVRLVLSGSPKGSLQLYPNGGVKNVTHKVLDRDPSDDSGRERTSENIGSFPVSLPQSKKPGRSLLSIDVLEYTFDLKPALTYSLCLSLKCGCLSNPSEQRVFKAFFDWPTLSPLTLDVSKHRLPPLVSKAEAGTRPRDGTVDSIAEDCGPDSSEVYRLYLECTLTNTTYEPSMDLTIDSVSLQTMGLFKSECVSHSQDGWLPFVLGKGQSTLFIFEVTLINPLSLVNLHSLSIGMFDIRWSHDGRESERKSGVDISGSAPITDVCRRHGHFKSDLLKRASPLCRRVSAALQRHPGSPSASEISGVPPPNIDLLIVNCARTVPILQVFECVVRVINNDRYRYRIRLTLDKHLSGKLLSCDNSFDCAGIVDAHSTLDATLKVIALSAGMYTVHGLLVTADRLVASSVLSGGLSQGLGSRSESKMKASPEQCFEIALRWMNARKPEIMAVQRHSEVYGSAAAAQMSLMSSMSGTLSKRGLIGGTKGGLSTATLRRILPESSDGRINAFTMAHLTGALISHRFGTRMLSPTDLSWNLHYDSPNQLFVECPVVRHFDPYQVEKSDGDVAEMIDDSVTEREEQKKEYQHQIKDHSQTEMNESDADAQEIEDEPLLNADVDRLGVLEPIDRVDSVSLIASDQRGVSMEDGCSESNDLVSTDSIALESYDRASIEQKTSDPPAPLLSQLDEGALEDSAPKEIDEDVMDAQGDAEVDVDGELLEASQMVHRLRVGSVDETSQSIT